MEDFIQLKKDNLVRIGIKDQYGNDTGKKLVFDIEDIELPLKYQEMIERHKKNVSYVNHQFLIISKKDDVKGKKLLSRNEEEKLKVLNEFYKRDMDALDLFLGEGSTQMILDIMGRKPYWTMFDDIGEAIKPIEKILEKNLDETNERIKEKYKLDEEEDILE